MESNGFLYEARRSDPDMMLRLERAALRTQTSHLSNSEVAEYIVLYYAVHRPPVAEELQQKFVPGPPSDQSHY